MKILPIALVIAFSLLTACGGDKAKEQASAEPETKTTTQMAEQKMPAKQTIAANETNNTEGKALHEDNCARCHDPEFYTRDDRKMKDYQHLHKMVGMCDAQLGTELFPEELQQITDFLNDDYYKFEKK